MGTLDPVEYHQQVLNIWECTISKKIIFQKKNLSEARIPWKIKRVAGKKCRLTHVDTKWMFQSTFLKLTLEYDMFQRISRSICYKQ